jgi:antitoxin ParD1/3/4
MALEITPELESVVQGIYAGGQYANEAEVLAAALHLLQQRDQLRRDLQLGVDELNRGDRLEAEEVFAELRQQAADLDKEVE